MLLIIIFNWLYPSKIRYHQKQSFHTSAWKRDQHMAINDEKTNSFSVGKSECFYSMIKF
ncbi:Uncharacterized protein dnm_006890 [Desulfonema magnum]|uniref:Uncharacterized protein n=1 Tax=Desulfonema magnum TaxID=45655 RepID=A0A975GKN2_9BACT|nr:Uncharacterized protein dnm_006890 [Desulfonema magnum]